MYYLIFHISIKLRILSVLFLSARIFSNNLPQLIELYYGIKAALFLVPDCPFNLLYVPSVLYEDPSEHPLTVQSL